MIITSCILSLLCSQQATAEFAGKIDGVRIYNRALSEGEVQAHYESRNYAETEPVVSVGSEL